MPKIVDFSPERVKAPFFLRIAALCLDYIVMMAVPVIWLLLVKFVGDGTFTISGWLWFIGIVVFLVNFLLLPLLTGKTLGKMLTGLTIVGKDGNDVDLLHLLLRVTIGYAATLLTLGLGFLIASVNSSGRTLHDMIGGTNVVRGRKTLV